MPYEYLFWLTIVVSVVFCIAFISFLWTFIERKRSKYIILSVICLMITISMIIIAIWAKDRYDKQEDGVEIERFDNNLDQIFLDYYKKATRENLKYKFKMVLDTESYITINKIDELFSTRYVVIYHLSNKEVIHLNENDEILDEQDMEG